MVKVLRVLFRLIKSGNYIWGLLDGLGIFLIMDLPKA
jgi:hypothetical protein